LDTYLLPSHQKESPHGDNFSPYGFYHCTFADNTSQVLLHWHEEAEFTIIRNGSAIYQIGSESYRVKQGDILFIAPNTLHAITPDDHGLMVSDTLVFHLDMVGFSIMDQCTISYIRPFYNGTLKPIPHMTDAHPAYRDLYDCIDAALNLASRRPRYYELLLKEKLNHFFFLMLNHSCMTETKISKSAALYIEKVKHALLFIQENYKEPLTVNQLAGLCNFSEVHFMKFFKNAVGLPCMEYIIRLRLKIAADLISTTDLSIAEIALESGFNNLSNFNRKFKACYCFTPSDYRKMLRQTDRSYAPGNAVDAAKKAAAGVISENGDDGVARFLEQDSFF